MTLDLYTPRPERNSLSIYQSKKFWHWKF